MDAVGITDVPAGRLEGLLPEIDLLLVTTTPVERDAVRSALRPFTDENALLRGCAGNLTLTLGQFGRYFAAHVECRPGSVGRAASQLTVAEAIQVVAPQAILVLGIAFGIDPTRQRPGDVLVADTVIPYEPERHGSERKPRGEPLHARTNLSERFRAFAPDWTEHREGERVNVFHGKVLSGEKLVDSQSFRDALLATFTDVEGGEMEGAGAYAAADRAERPILLIKAISDFADGKKAQTEEGQPFAAAMAVSLARYVLAKPDVLAALGARDRGLPGERDAITRGITPPRQRLLEGIDRLPEDWSNRIGSFIDAYRGTVFCGREDDVDRVQAWLDREGMPPNLLVTAPAGRGKSALLVRLALRLAERVDVDVVFIPLSLRFDTQRPDVFLACLVARLAFLHGREPPDLRHASVDVRQGMLVDDLMRPPPAGRRIVVILDGLDEAVGWEVWPGLLSPRHPDSVRIIVSARQQPDDLEGLRWLGSLGWDAPRAAECLLLPSLEARDVEAALRRLPAPLDRISQRYEIVEELVRLCEGEPLTLWLMLEDIEKRGETPLDLDVQELRAREPGLAAWFARWLQEQRKHWGEPSPLRERAVRALLHLIAVAEGGLTREDVLWLLRDETPDSFALDEAMRPISRLIHGDGKATGYVPAHPEFGRYLRDELTPRERKAWRGRIAAWTRTVVEDLASRRIAPSDVPRYVVQNRATFLQEEGAPAASWMNLVTPEWYAAWQAHEPGPSGFLEGVDRAWKALAADGEHLAEEAQCALVRGSVGSTLAQVTPALLELLLEERIWTPEQAFAYVRAAPKAHDSDLNCGKLLEVLAPHLPDVLLPRLFEVACDVEEIPFGRLGEASFAELLRRMALVSPTEARIALRRVSRPGTRALRLIELAKHLPKAQRAPLLEEALSLARRREDPFPRSYVLREIGEAMAEPMRGQVLRESFEATRDVSDLGQRWFRFCQLVPVLLEDMRERAFDEAMDAACALQGSHRHHALEHLVDDLPSPFRERALRALEVEVLATEDRHEAVARRFALCDRLPEAERSALLDATFELIGQMPEEQDRIQALESRLHFGGPRKDELSRHEFATRALRIAGNLARPWLRVRMVVGLKNVMPPEALWPVIEPVWNTIESTLRSEDAVHYDCWLRDLVCIAPIERALEVVRPAQLAWLRAEFLTRIAGRLPEEACESLIAEALEAAGAVVLPQKRADIHMQILLVAPASQRQAVFEALLAAIGEIKDPWSRTQAMMRLGHMLVEPWQTYAFEAARASATRIDMPHARFDTLVHIAGHVAAERREEVLEEAFEAAQQEQHPRSRLDHLTSLASATEGPRRRELLRMALEWSRTLGDDGRRVRAMLAYAPYLPTGDIASVVECIEQIGRLDVRVDAYVDLLSHCPAERTTRFERALDAARSITRGRGIHTRALRLARLVSVAPEALRTPLLREVLETARGDFTSIDRPPAEALIEDEYADMRGGMVDGEVERALLLVSPHLPDRWIPEALSIAEQIPTVHTRTNVMISLARRLGEPEQLKIAEKILAVEVPHVWSLNRTETRSRLARAVAPLLPEPRRSEVLASLPAPSSEKPELDPASSDDVLRDHLNVILGSDKADASLTSKLPWLLARLPNERRQRLVAHMHDSLPRLEPSRRGLVALQLLPYVPESWIDSCLDGVMISGNAGLEVFPRIASRLNARQLDRALTLIETNTSSGSPRDARLEALAATASERLRQPHPPRERLRKLLHDTVYRRTETRAEVLLVLSAMAPLIVGLGGTAAATGVVRAIRRAGEWWP